MKTASTGSATLTNERHSGVLGGIPVECHGLRTARRSRRAFDQAIGKIRFARFKSSQRAQNLVRALDDQVLGSQQQPECPPDLLSCQSEWIDPAHARRFATTPLLSRGSSAQAAFHLMIGGRIIARPLQEEPPWPLERFDCIAC